MCLVIQRNADILMEFNRVLEIGARYTLSAAGRDLFVSLRPMTSCEEINRSLELLKHLLFLLEKGESIPIDHLIDPRPLLQKLESPGAFLEGRELLELREFFKSLASIQRFVKKHCEDAPLLYDAFSGLTSLPDIRKHISAVIDEDGNVKDNASVELKKLRRKEAASLRNIQKEVRKQLRLWDQRALLQEQYHTLRGDRYVLPVKAPLKNRVQGIVHDVSGSGETVFIEPMEIVTLSNELATIRIEIRDEVIRILVRLSDILRESLEEIESNAGRAAQFDAVQAKARFAWEKEMSIPEIASEGGLNLMNAHHPLLYLMNSEKSVPVNLKLSSKDRVLVISGPNAGGKTTALKTIGLLSMMVQSGLAAPVFADSRFVLYNSWFEDIGDAQDVTEGLSTFSAHSRNLSRIIRNADEKSLVLLDELGTATDPSQGGALAVAVLEALVKRAGLTVATSHLSPVKAWAEDYPGARNASFRLDEKTHQPTFRIMLDVPGPSEALLIARREGLPEEVLKRAENLLPEGEADLSRLIQSLHAREKELEESRRHVRKLMKEHENLQKKIASLQDFLKEKEQRLTRNMLAEKESMLRETRSFIEEQIASMSAPKKAGEARKKVSRELQDVQKKSKKLRKQVMEPVDPSLFQEGQEVFVRSLNENGTIERIRRDKGKATILLRGMKVSAPLAGLNPANKKKREETERRRRVQYTRKSDVRWDLDLHGMRVEEMLSVVEQHLNDAILADLPSVRLVHGIGTGALRNALRDYLRTHPLVRSFRAGKPEEGGGGVTIVQF